jgi:hypothetical protein
MLFFILLYLFYKKELIRIYMNFRLATIIYNNYDVNYNSIRNDFIYPLKSKSINFRYIYFKIK